LKTADGIGSGGSEAAERTVIGAGIQVVMGLEREVEDEPDSEEKGNCDSINLTCLET
jgi:hypothetical protein